MTFDFGAADFQAPATTGLMPRPRSAGPLGNDAVRRCRIEGRALAFDPLQGGWVPADAEDDLTHLDLEACAAPATHGHPAHATVTTATDRQALHLGDYLLRPWRQGDAPRFAELLGDAAVWQYLPERYPGTLGLEDAEGMIALATARADHDVLAIVKDGTVIGQVRLEFDAGGTAAEVSYWLGRAYWGEGHAGRVVPAFVGAAASRHPRLDRLTARVHDDNPASAAVLARAGFARTPDADAPPWRYYARVLR
jgi:RimJ/RimL family protein N-acetyltransferase